MAISTTTTTTTTKPNVDPAWLFKLGSKKAICNFHVWIFFVLRREMKLLQL
jgi:hypothetical protein